MIRRSLILDTTVRLVFDGALVLSIYLLFAGHNQPGGGFVGGLVAGAAIALRYVAGGLGDVLTNMRFKPWTFLSVGLALAVSVAMTPLLFGNGPLDQDSYSTELAVLGKIKFTSATIFDTGVYLIVLGLILMIFEALGEYQESDPQPDRGDAS